jgi:predicted metal-dependent peptidase
MAILTTAERVTKACICLQRERPFYGFMLLWFKRSQTESKDIPTMGVNERGRLYWNNEWVSSLTDEELQGVVCHEVMHVALGTSPRRKDRDPSLWNVATDAVINHMLITDGVKLPEKGIIPKNGVLKLDDKEYTVDGKIAEEIYDEIERDAEKIYCLMESKGDGSSNPLGMDVHLDDKLDTGEDDTFDSGDDADESRGSGRQKNQKEWQKRMVEAAVAARSRGKLPGNIESLIDHILHPQLDWRTRFRKFISDQIPSDYSNRRPGRKFYGTQVWSPIVVKENIKVIVGVDASGSTHNDREKFLGELSGILTAYHQVEARVIFWDAHVNPKNDFVFTTDMVDKLKTIKLEDVDGGTTLSCYTEYVEKKRYQSRIHVILTDGYIENKPRIPNANILFVITSDGSDENVKGYGEVCRLTK